MEAKARLVVIVGSPSLPEQLSEWVQSCCEGFRVEKGPLEEVMKLKSRDVRILLVSGSQGELELAQRVKRKQPSAFVCVWSSPACESPALRMSLFTVWGANMVTDDQEEPFASSTGEISIQDPLKVQDAF